MNDHMKIDRGAASNRSRWLWLTICLVVLGVIVWRLISRDDASLTTPPQQTGAATAAFEQSELYSRRKGLGNGNELATFAPSDVPAEALRTDSGVPLVPLDLDRSRVQLTVSASPVRDSNFLPLAAYQHARHERGDPVRSVTTLTLTVSAASEVEAAGVMAWWESAVQHGVGLARQRDGSLTRIRVRGNSAVMWATAGPGLRGFPAMPRVQENPDDSTRVTLAYTLRIGFACEFGALEGIELCIEPPAPDHEWREMFGFHSERPMVIPPPFDTWRFESLTPTVRLFTPKVAESSTQPATEAPTEAPTQQQGTARVEPAAAPAL